MSQNKSRSKAKEKYPKETYRVVLDTNVYISLFISPKGSLAPILSAATQRRFSTLVSPFIIHETAKTLDRKFAVPEQKILLFLKAIARLSEIVVPESIPDVIASDPDDNNIVACAIAGKADLVVTGNTKHFRKLKRHEDISFVTPAEFVQMIDGL